ncbi:Cation/H(+) antiporter like [Actinidia chinensis var. chinensis]|uniref:Cation/H(+) antiporter like n=1 Tax=Actinidia chinensis var. chinensis TaxID=1590841 RepID=A0A2R6QL99_ACTCC|nr:Cation/H(+) antiporter like [Actinidia chinensis var. chinensis]
MANGSSEGGLPPFNLSYFNMVYTCEYMGASVCSKGFFRADHPLMHPLPLLLFELGIVLLVNAVIQILLRPFKQPRFVSDMLTGILLGPSIIEHFSRHELYASLFRGKQSIIIDILELLSLIYFTFLVAVRTDLGVIRTSGRLAWVIGITASVLPVALAVPTSHFLGKSYADLSLSLDTLSVLQATTSFQVTSVLLEDLKLLNSEIGRLALSSSLISNLFGMIFKIGSATLSRVLYIGIGAEDLVLSEISRLVLIGVTIYFLRPIIFWFMRKIPEGGSINESHVITITVMLFGMSLASEVLGLQAYFGAMILGFAVPAGPPLGSGLTRKLNLVFLALLLPSYIIDAGRHVNVALIKGRSFGPAEVIILLAYLGKLGACVVPAKLFRMPYQDSFALGLILCSQGFFDVMLFKRALRFTILSEELYSVLTIMAVVHAAIATPIISYLYNPSKRYVNYQRRTIQHCRRDAEFRILTCIHEEESVFSIMNLLKASYPSRESPLGIYVLDIMKLDGREHPVFINHQFHRCLLSNSTRTARIISAFRHYEFLHIGMVRNQYFTTITPYASMHDDICTLALQKNTNLLIVPFQKLESKALRGVKRNLLEKSPCSIGFLVDKRIVTYFGIEKLNESKFHVCVIYTGGPDSREALAYGTRMAEYPDTRLTVVRLIAEDEFIIDLMDAKLDLKAITELSNLCSYMNRIEYKEVYVKDGAEVSRVLLSLNEDYDFILVGRRVDKESPLVSGLIEWDNYDEELGIIGDMIASPDMKSNASVLVLQQQTTVEDLIPKGKI